MKQFYLKHKRGIIQMSVLALIVALGTLFVINAITPKLSTAWESKADKIICVNATAETVGAIDTVDFSLKGTILGAKRVKIYNLSSSVQLKVRVNDIYGREASTNELILDSTGAGLSSYIELPLSVDKKYNITDLTIYTASSTANYVVIGEK